MAKGTSNTHTDILRYALPHLEQERDRIQAQIDHIHRQLGQKVSALAAPRQLPPAELRLRPKNAYSALLPASASQLRRRSAGPNIARLRRKPPSPNNSGFPVA